jgi:hypothetical protein
LESDAQETGETRDAGSLSSQGEVQNDESDHEYQQEVGRPETIGLSQDVFAIRADVRLKGRRTGLSFDEGLLGYYRRFPNPRNGVDDRDDHCDDDGEEADLALDVIHSEDNFSRHH